jgi:beta-galactosidase
VEERRRTWFTERGVAIARAGSPDGADHLDLFAAEMHYWRGDHASWAPGLAALAELGFGVVSTYVPWSVHEAGGGPGGYDWSGNLDLRGFLDQIDRAGMRAIVRPGPHINAELTGFGFPDRVLDDGAMRALTGRGTPAWLPAPPRMFAVPSYASAAFRAAVVEWYEAFAEKVRPHLAPDGPVIAVQVDNEHQQFFRLGAYDLDYHPDALAWWDEATGGLEAPRAWNADDAEACARWVAFKEEYAARALGWMSDALAGAGLGGVARFHNLPPSEPELVHVPRTELAVGGVAGMDFYHRGQDIDTYSRRALYLAGTAGTLPFAPEIGAGGPPWLLPMTADEQRSVTLGVLAAGVRAFNIYMGVERERWYGAPIRDDGELLATARWYRRLLRVLEDVDWTQLRRRARIALVASRCDARYAIASSLAEPMTPVVLAMAGLGPAGAAELSRDRDATAYAECAGQVLEAVRRSGVGYAIVDESCPVARFQDYELVVMPTIRRVDEDAWTTMHGLVAAGTAIVVGPGKPERPVPAGAGHLRRASLADPDALGADLAALVGGADPHWHAAAPGDVQCSVFEDAAGEAVVLFVGNRTGEAHRAAVRAPAGAALRDVFDDAAVDPAAIPLSPFQVRMLAVTASD